MKTNRMWLTGLTTGLVLGAAAFTVSGALWAQNNPARPPAPPSGGGARVACIDVVRVFNEYQRQKDLSEEMKQVQQKLELENQQRRQRIDSLQATLDAMNQNDPAYVQKLREMMEMQIDYKNWFEVRQASLNREIAFWSAKMYREIAKATEDIAQQQGYDIVLYKDEFQTAATDPNEVREQIRVRKLIYANPRVDLSQVVQEKLNADYRATPQKQMIQVP